MAESIVTKQCPTCQETKPVSEFHRNRGKPDGLATSCKACFQIQHKVYRDSPLGQATLANARTYPACTRAKRRYARSEKGKASQERFRKTVAGRAMACRASRKRRAEYPEETKAQWRIHELVRQGKLPLIHTCICVECGKQAQHYHHHKGYSGANVEDVIPVCVKCHSVLDNAAGRFTQQLARHRKLA